MNTKEARQWVAAQLRQLADDIECQRVLAYHFNTPQEIVEIPAEEGDRAVRRALTGVKSLQVVYTTHPLAVDRVGIYTHSLVCGDEHDEWRDFCDSPACVEVSA